MKAVRLPLLDRAEGRLMRRWARQLPPPVDSYLGSVSEAASYSRLWLAVAAVMGVAAGERGRRAAADGVFAIGVTSALVNGPLKLVFRRQRPPIRRRLRRYPRTSSFPSGHAASAFAFTTAATRALPEAGGALFPLAASVAYSRIYLGVHYPTDVLVGAAVGATIGTAAGPAARTLRATARETIAARTAQPVLKEAILVASPHAGNSGKLERAKRLIEKRGIRIATQLDITEIDRLRELLDAEIEPRLVIAAGGDGTVGSVAGALVGSDHVMAIMPLGTSNDFARALDIPMNTRLAAMLFASGRASEVDVGRLARPGESPRYFVHAATAGVNVSFAKLATRGSVRTRLGRLTYLAAAAYALRDPSPFTGVLHHDGTSEQMRLLQLSVINAPIFGGPLGLSVEGSRADDHLLDVLAVEDVGPPKLLFAGLLLLLRVKRRVAGVKAFHTEKLAVETDSTEALSLDGELGAAVPGEIETVPGGLRVLVPTHLRPEAPPPFRSRSEIP
jgi:diacylglycerol kinase family enzyme/membrane-associated phospholipid phosphatase